jgi:hypothetical protein
MGYGREMYYTGYRDGSVWLSLGLIGSRLTFTDDETINALGLGMVRQQSNNRTAMEAALQYTLVSAGQGAELTTAQMVNDQTTLAHFIESGIVFDGFYQSKRDWYFREDMKQLHFNRICSYWDKDDTQVTSSGRYCTGEKKNTYWSGFWIYADDGYEGSAILNYNENRRLLLSLADPKDVQRTISKVLTRMKQGGRITQIGSGRGRQFTWKNWTWLEDYRRQHTVSNTKMRKIGDVVNGWEYYVDSVQEKFGVKVNSYKWKPHNTDDDTVWSVADMCYFNKDEAQADADALNEVTRSFMEQFANRLTKKMYVKQDGSVKNDTNIRMYSVQSTTLKMRLPADAVVEDLPSPAEVRHRRFAQVSKGFSAWQKEIGLTANNLYQYEKVVAQ